MKWLKRLGWMFGVVIILFGFFSLIGSVVVSYQQTGEPPGDPPPLTTQVVQEAYREVIGRSPSGAELQKIIQAIETGQISNVQQLEEAIKSSRENK